MSPDVGPAEPVVAARYQRDGGLSLMPYSSSDLELSSLVALMAPNGVDASQLAAYLYGIRSTQGRDPRAADDSPSPDWPVSASRSCRRSGGRRGRPPTDAHGP